MSEDDPRQNRIVGAIDPNACRRFDNDDPLVLAYIEELIAKDEPFYRHFLVWLVLNQQLSKFVGTSPIVSGDQISASMTSRICAFGSELKLSLNAIEINSFKNAVQSRLRIDRHPERHMKILYAKRDDQVSND